MKIENREPIAQTSGIKANAFKLDVNAKVYDMLISKLYRNKSGAVLRELSCNAYDSHVDNGNPEVPFEIHLPTWLDKTFSIRDYGTGIPHDAFEDIYTNIGSSTRDASNEFTGAMGLGSKSCFCMTDTFSVENIRSSRKTTWLCFKDGGCPQVSKIADEPTTEPSGLKVSFCFTSDSARDFSREITKQLRYFPVKPKITGGEHDIRWPKFPVGWETKDYFYIKDGSYNPQHYVVMGNVCYPFTSSDVDYRYNSLLSEPLTLKMNIGDVDIPPSRENLEFTDKTKAALNNALMDIKASYAADFQAKIDACKTYCEFRQAAYQANRGLSDRNNIQWNGDAYSWYEATSGSYQGTKEGLSIRRIMRSYKNVYRTASISMPDIIAGTVLLYVNDLGRGFRKHINDNHGLLETQGMHSYILEPDAYTKVTMDTEVSKTQNLGKKVLGIDVKLLSSKLGFPVITKGSSLGKAKPNQFFTLAEGSSYGKLASYLKEYKGTLPTEGYYVPLNRWDSDSAELNNRDMMAISRLKAELGDSFKAEIYMVRKASVKSIEGNLKDAKTLVKDMTVKLKKLRKDLETSDATQACIPSSLHNLTDYDWEKVVPEIHELIEYRNTLAKTDKYKYSSNSLISDVTRILGDAYTHVPTTQKTIKHPAKMEKNLVTYRKMYDSIFKSLSRGYYTSQSIEAVYKFLASVNITPK